MANIVNKNCLEKKEKCSSGQYVAVGQSLSLYQEDTLRLIEANRDRLMNGHKLASEDNQSQSVDIRQTIEFD